MQSKMKYADKILISWKAKLVNDFGSKIVEKKSNFSIIQKSIKKGMVELHYISYIIHTPEQIWTAGNLINCTRTLIKTWQQEVYT